MEEAVVVGVGGGGAVQGKPSRIFFEKYTISQVIICS